VSVSDTLRGRPDGSPESMRSGLFVVHVGPPGPLDEGPAVYRTLQPCRALGELPDILVVSGSALSPALYEGDLLLDADVLVIGDVATPDLLTTVAARRRLRRLTAYELTRHPFAAPAGQSGPPRTPDFVGRSLTPTLARQADGVQFSSAALESEAAWLGPRRAVFPSQLWDGPAPLPLRRLDRVVIGWGGSAAHREDLQAVIPAIATVLDRHPEARLAIMSDESVRPVLDPLPADRVSFTPWGSLGAYYKFLEGIDVGIAPLSPTPYNRCRSDIRFVEYAAHGVLAVCADLEPYREAVRPGQTGYLYRDTAELETVLERALAEGEVRAAIPARAARQVGSERLERRHAAGRLGFYLAVAAEIGIELPGPSGARLFPPAAVADPAAAARSFVGSRYFALGDGEVEGLLTAALDHARGGAIDDARRILAAAARLAPHSYLPPLLLAKIETPVAALEALARAAALNAGSCEVAHLQGVNLLEVGDRTGAAAAFERARAIAPIFGAPQERLGALAEAAGRIDEACRLYEEAALHNGSFALPIARLAAIAQRDGKIDKAVGLLERSLQDDPDLSLTNFLIGRAYVELRRYHQARVHLLRAVDGAIDRAAVLTELAKAEMGLGNLDAARNTLEEARRAPAAMITSS
jgi:tetratricopeptide (TPR) repeat protein/glycosyltransferase involved in cell wall biosynthesis